MKKTTTELKAILEKEGVNISTEYLDFLTNKNFQSSIAIFEDEDEFELYSLDEICQEITIDGQTMIRIKQLAAYTKTILEVNGDYTNATEKNRLLELSQCLSIGYENTRVLYLDNDDNDTLHVFHLCRPEIG
ncbi:MAG: hypothetical protein GY810_01325 [Aureispira sp.]|nr:hypothetical protein [Aureispira sp.]